MQLKIHINELYLRQDCHILFRDIPLIANFIVTCATQCPRVMMHVHMYINTDSMMTTCMYMYIYITSLHAKRLIANHVCDFIVPTYDM